MHVLVVSKFNDFSVKLIEKIRKEGCSVTLIALGKAELSIQGRVKIFRPPLSIDQYRDICHNYSFSAAIFLACASDSGDIEKMSQEFSAFQAVLCAFKWKYVILQSDCHLFGIHPDYSAYTMKQQDRNIAETQIVLYEILFRRYCSKNKIPLAVLRTGYIYDPRSKTTNIPALLSGDKMGTRIVVSAKDDINFLHVGDALDAFMRCLLGTVTGVYNVCAAQWVRAGSLLEKLATHAVELPEIGTEPGRIISERDDPVLYCPTVYAEFKQRTDWVPVTGLSGDSLAQPGESMQAQDRGKWWSKFFAKRPMSVINTIMGFVITVGLQKLLFSVANLRTFDMLVVYITLVACKYGTSLGFLASLLACVYYYLDNIETNTSITDVLFFSNMWMPFIVYLLLGTVLGYLHKLRVDKTQMGYDNMEIQEQKLRLSKELCEEALRTKDMLQEQIFNFEDSFGKIFQMIRQLNSLQSEKVLSAAIGVFEQAIHAERIAIYALSPDGRYARLISCSNKLENILQTVDLDQNPELKLAIADNTLYINRQLSDGLSYACAISSEDHALYFVALYGCSLHQFTLAFQNQFRIVCSLAQNSLLQALQYEQATWHKRYVDGTLVLNSEAFRERLKMLLESEDKAKTKWLVFQVLAPNTIWELNRCIAPILRQHDFVGLNTCGRIYVVFLGACDEDQTEIIERMNLANISLKLIKKELIKT